MTDAVREITVVAVFKAPDWLPVTEPGAEREEAVRRWVTQQLSDSGRKRLFSTREIDVTTLVAEAVASLLASQ